MADLKEISVSLLSTTTISLAAAAATTLYTVPTGKRCILIEAVLVSAGTPFGGTSALTIGQVGALTDFIGTQTVSNLDAENDAVVMRPIPATPHTTPLKQKSYAAGTVIQADVTTGNGVAGCTLHLFGFLIDA